jgi:nitroreductase
MDIHTALTSRRTIQRFTSAPLADDVLERALNAAQMAPCHKLTFPWRFVALGPETRDVAIRAAAASKAKGGDASVFEPGVRAKLGPPHWLIAVVQRLDADLGRREEDYAATCCAVQNLMLSVHADGAGSKWATGAMLQAPELLAAMGVDPVAERVVGLISIGTPEKVPAAPQRPAVDLRVRP